MKWTALVLSVCLWGVVPASRVEAQIVRWDSGEVIPGTEDIQPGPQAALDQRELQFAWLYGQPLAGANFSDSDLASALLSASDLRGADFSAADLTAGSLAFCDLTGADLSGANLTLVYLHGAVLRDADLTGAVVARADFRATTARGLTPEQLYSTASYQAKDLRGIGLWDNQLANWDFSGQDLTGAQLSDTNLTGARFEGAEIVQANFGAYALYAPGETPALGPSNLTQEQLASTASYQRRNLRGVGLSQMNIAGWDLSQQDLSGADLSLAIMAGTNLTGAEIVGANLQSTTLFGLDTPQLYSTASYQAGVLTGVNLSYNILTGWDFNGKDLRGASFEGSNLTGIKLADAIIEGANLANTTSRGFSRDIFYTTASYKAKNLRGVYLWGNNLSNWDFEGQDLSEANLDIALVTGANFRDARLVNVTMESSVLNGADLTRADLRGAKGTNFTGANLRNAIRPDGRIIGLLLAEGEELVIRDEDGVADPPPAYWLTPRESIPITIQGNFVMSGTSVLRVVFEEDPWDSTILIDPNGQLLLDGTLRLTFADGIDPQTQVGRTFRLFEWNQDVAATNHFRHIDRPKGDFYWHLGDLYTEGTVSLWKIGDTDGDNDVDTADLNSLLTRWTGAQEPCLDPALGVAGDFDADCDVDSADLNALIAQWTGAAVGSSAPMQPVAEPSGGAATVLAMLLVLAWRRMGPAARRLR